MASRGFSAIGTTPAHVNYCRLGEKAAASSAAVQYYRSAAVGKAVGNQYSGREIVSLALSPSANPSGVRVTLTDGFTPANPNLVK